jgi:hypothetical protein
VTLSVVPLKDVPEHTLDINDESETVAWICVQSAAISPRPWLLSPIFKSGFAGPPTVLALGQEYD